MRGGLIEDSLGRLRLLGGVVVRMGVGIGISLFPCVVADRHRRRSEGEIVREM